MMSRVGENCEFDKYSSDEALKDQLIEHCCSLLEIARSKESANFQAANMENTSSHDRSENARHLTDSSVSEADEWVKQPKQPYCSPRSHAPSHSSAST